MRRVTSLVMLTPLLVGTLALTFNIQPVKSDWTWTETIYIRADGSVYPDTAPISSVDNITYTLTDNIVGDVPAWISMIFVERDNIVFDGAGYTLQGTQVSSSHGIELVERSNVTIKNVKIKLFGLGIVFYYSNHSNICANNLTSNWTGIALAVSSNNSIFGNNIIAQHWGIYIYESTDNTFYHNNFINNTQNVYFFTSGLTNFWDDGYPSGGNYWSDYAGVDEKRGPNQDQSGSDGIGDTPYVIDGNNTDTYPLMGPFSQLTLEGENVTVFPTDDVGLIFGNVTSEGFTTVNKTGTGPEPPSGFRVEQYYDIETTANYSGRITIRIIYDDSNMTQEEENLQLIQWNETTQQWINITIYIDVENNLIIGETTHLSVFGVTACGFILGDVDRDGDVDIFDIVLMAGCYGSKEGDPEYIANCDLDGDGDIDIFDIVAACSHYGESW